MIVTRFGDPILCLSSNSKGFAYGTAFGRVVYTSTETYEQQVITDVSEEPIKSLFLTPDDTLYYSVGDLYAVIAKNLLGSPEMQLVNHDIFHSFSGCPKYLVLMHGPQVLLVPGLSNSPQLKITNLDSCGKRQFMAKDFLVPFDFDGKRLLVMFYVGRCRSYEVLDVELEGEGEGGYTQAMRYAEPRVHVTLLRLCGGFVVFVEGGCRAKVWDIEGKGVCAEVHMRGVVAVGYYHDGRGRGGDSEENREENREEGGGIIVVLVNDCGLVWFWDMKQVVYRLQIAGADKKKYFSLGYPYFVAVCDGCVVVTTDFGVVLTNSDSILCKSEISRVDHDHV